LLDLGRALFCPFEKKLALLMKMHFMRCIPSSLFIHEGGNDVAEKTLDNIM